MDYIIIIFVYFKASLRLIISITVTILRDILTHINIKTIFNT